MLGATSLKIEQTEYIKHEVNKLLNIEHFMIPSAWWQ